MPPRKREPETAIVSTSVLCDYLGVTERNLHQLVQAKILPKHDHAQYDLKACTRAYINYIKTRIEGSKKATESTLTSERARLTKAKADEAEINAKERKGDLVAVDAVEQAWEKIGSVLRSRLLTVPAKIAARLALAKTAPDAQRIVEREITDALNELSKTNVMHEEPDEED